MILLDPPAALAVPELPTELLPPEPMSCATWLPEHPIAVAVAAKRMTRER